MWEDNVIICCITLVAFSKNPRSILSLFRCEASGITNKLSTVRVEVITGVLLRMQVFWDTMLCHWASGFWYFTRLWDLHLEGTRGPVFLDSLALKTKELCSFKMLGPADPAAQHNIPEDWNTIMIITEWYSEHIKWKKVRGSWADGNY